MGKDNKKIIMLFVFAIFFIALFVIWQMGGKDTVEKITGRDGKGGDENTSIDAPQEDDGKNVKDLRYETLERKECLKEESEYSGLSNNKLSWWIKRDDNHQPSGCDTTIDISEYNGYYCVPGEEEKVIYLTFDCGYENGYTAQMLDILKDENVPACFFVTQTYIRDSRDLVVRMKEEGHQVGNHTVTHPSMPAITFDKMVNEIRTCASYMEETTGYAMDPYFRPPSGEYNEKVLAVANDLGYKIIFWSIAYLDYDVNKQPGAEYVKEHFRKYHHNGAIVLMHNVSSSNAEALRTVIQELKSEGYTFKSLNEIK